MQWYLKPTTTLWDHRACNSNLANEETKTQRIYEASGAQIWTKIFLP